MRRGRFLFTGAAAAAAAAFLKSVALASESDAGGASQLELVIGTIVPFESPAFPAITVRRLAARVDDLFELSASPPFTISLGIFANVALFPTATTELISAEEAQSGAIHRAQILAGDQLAFHSANLPAATFAALSIADRRRYLSLWQHSAFNVRRRFYGSLRAVTLIALYSMPESWSSIGYAGPLLPDGRK